VKTPTSANAGQVGTGKTIARRFTLDSTPVVGDRCQTDCLLNLAEHLRLTGTALKHWLLAQTLDAVAIGVIWTVGLLIIGVPLAPLWGVLGGLLQFIPHLGPVLALIGPAIAGSASGGWMRFVYVLILYAGIAVLDGLALQPYLMRRTAKVPLWASILFPIVLGFLIPFWGVLLAPPLLAVIYAYRTRRQPGRGGSLSA
jgi:predicted PurR-regulated permease PerM